MGNAFISATGATTVYTGGKGVGDEAMVEIPVKAANELTDKLYHDADKSAVFDAEGVLVRHFSDPDDVDRRETVFCITADGVPILSVKRDPENLPGRVVTEEEFIAAVDKIAAEAKQRGTTYSDLVTEKQQGK